MTTELAFDGCEVVRKLRSGPATNWYLGKQRWLGRNVVIKALSPNISPDSPFAAPLEREARLLSQLQHRRITQLYEFVRRPKSMWLVLEFVDGYSLAELCEKKPRFSVAGALAIVAQLLEALEYVHSRGVIHRDIQPKNLWLGRDGELKLANLFLAAEASAPAPPELLEGDSGYAVLKYMSPEQVLGEPTDPSSDLFSVGTLLYELVTGVHPFEGADPASRRRQSVPPGTLSSSVSAGYAGASATAGDTANPSHTAQRIRRDAPPPLAQYLANPPPILERILARSLQKLPTDRFSNAREMATIVKQALEQLGQPDATSLNLESLSERGLLDANTTGSVTPRKTLPSVAPLGERRSSSIHQSSVRPGGSARSGNTPTTKPSHEPRNPAVQAAKIYAGLAALFLAGSAVIHSITGTEALPRQTAPLTLPLVPENAAQLRVVCWPWANVFIDGQYVATTPLAESIPLAPGVHYARFEHPNAVTDQRELRVAPGQYVRLDVRLTLNVPLAVSAEATSVKDAGPPSP